MMDTLNLNSISIYGLLVKPDFLIAGGYQISVRTESADLSKIRGHVGSKINLKISKTSKLRVPLFYGC